MALSLRTMAWNVVLTRTKLVTCGLATKAKVYEGPRYPTVVGQEYTEESDQCPLLSDIRGSRPVRSTWCSLRFIRATCKDQKGAIKESSRKDSRIPKTYLPT
jgi:hypothetical protein